MKLQTGLKQVTLSINAETWRRIVKEANKRGTSIGVIITAAMDAYDELPEP